MVDFPTTHWTLLRTTTADPARRREAWEQLSRRYQRAIRGYLSRSLGGVDVDDHVQEFLLRSVRDDWWQRADPLRGRFRGFLRMLLDRYVGHERERRRLRSVEAEAIDAFSDDGPGPDAVYDREFAASIAERALARVAGDYARRGQAALFAALQPLIGSASPGELKSRAAALDSTPNALAAALSRLRRAHVVAMRAELAELIDDPGELETEWAALGAALAAS